MENDKFIFGKPVTGIIKERISIRAYASQPVPGAVRKKIDIFLNGLIDPGDTAIRFTTIDSDALKKDTGVKLGTYGMIRGASWFLVAAVKKSDEDPVKLGYLFEKAVLYATSLGLGTCWLGGTFNKGEFTRAASLKEDEAIRIVSPIGYAKDRRDLLESIVRLGAGSNNRKAWEELFFSDGFSRHLSRKDAGSYGEALEMVRLAPSASNKQPWRIVESNGKYHFYLRHTKGYGKAMGYDMQRVDMGIAMCHFELAASEMGLSGKWNTENPEISNVPDDTDYIISWVDMQQ